MISLISNSSKTEQENNEYSPKLNTKVETFLTQNFDHNSSSQKLSSIKSDLSQPLLRHLDSYEIQENLCNKKNIYVLTDIRKGNKYILKIDDREKKKILKICSKLEGLDEWKDYLVLEDLSLGSTGILIKPGENSLTTYIVLFEVLPKKEQFEGRVGRNRLQVFKI